MRTVFTNLLVREDSLKCVLEDLFSTHFLFKKELINNHTIVNKNLVFFIISVMCM